MTHTNQILTRSETTYLTNELLAARSALEEAADGYVAPPLEHDHVVPYAVDLDDFMPAPRLLRAIRPISGERQLAAFRASARSPRNKSVYRAIVDTSLLSGSDRMITIDRAKGRVVKDITHGALRFLQPDPHENYQAFMRRTLSDERGRMQRWQETGKHPVIDRRFKHTQTRTLTLPQILGVLRDTGTQEREKTAFLLSGFFALGQHTVGQVIKSDLSSYEKLDEATYFAVAIPINRALMSS